MTDMSRYIGLFLEEAQEHVDALAHATDAIASGDTTAMDEAFRAAHSIKGAAATVGLEEIAALAHGLEDLLGAVRDGADPGPMRDLLHESGDALQRALEALRNGQVAPGADDLAARLRAAADKLTPIATTAPATHTTSEAAPSGDGPRTTEGLPPEGTYHGLRLRLAAKCIAPRARLMVVQRAIGTVTQLLWSDPPADAWHTLKDDPRPVYLAVGPRNESTQVGIAGLIERLRLVPDLDDVAEAGPFVPAAPKETATPTATLQTPGTVRIDVRQLDRFIEGIGEVRTAQRRLADHLERALGASPGFELGDALHQLDLGIRELADQVFEIRRLPISLVLDRLPRVARDAARRLGKRVRIDIIGADVTVDRSLVEALADPLVHLVRNAVDHGIEAPDTRRAAGKPEEGVITVTVERADANVVIQVQDDGAGVDPQRVIDKAVRRGLLATDDARTTSLSAGRILDLITTPGFTTTTEVTAISGRGVGLDVVRAGVEAVGGNITLTIRPEGGTRFSLRLPSNLAVIEALPVTVDDQPFFLPTTSVVAALALSHDDELRGRLEPPQRLEEDAPGGADDHDLVWGTDGGRRPRRQAIPIVTLPGATGIHDAHGPDRTGIVIEHRGRRICIAVDRVAGSQEIVTKPLGHPDIPLPLVAGATVMADGRVAIILDAAGLCGLAPR